MPEPAIERTRMKAALLAVLLVGMVLAAYGPALRAGFIWDDDDYVTENPLLHTPDGFERIWLSMDAPSQYFPLVYSTFRIEYGLWGLDPFGYHLINVLFHAASALLLWLLLRRLDISGAWFAAAVFALHPVHVESVAWITERKNVMSLFFSLASLLAWLRFIEPRGGSWRRYYAVSLVFYALALSSKAMACTLPAAQLLLLWLRGHPIDWRRIAQVMPFFALGVALGGVITYWERHHVGTVGERFSSSFIEAFLIATRAIWFYLGKLLWPTQLTFSYPKFAIDPSQPLQYSWAIAGAVLLWILWRWRSAIGRAPLAAAIFFVASLSPLLGFIPLFTFWYTYVADHYQYVASIGPIVLFSAGTAQLLRDRTALEAEPHLRERGNAVARHDRQESHFLDGPDEPRAVSASRKALRRGGRRVRSGICDSGRRAPRPHRTGGGAVEIGPRARGRGALQGSTRAAARPVQPPPGARAPELETRGARGCDRPLRGDDRARPEKSDGPLPHGSSPASQRAPATSARPLPKCAGHRPRPRRRAQSRRANRGPTSRSFRREFGRRARQPAVIRAARAWDEAATNLDSSVG